MTVIGLTGSFGTGKTFVASIMKSLGARVIDADSIAHGVIREGGPCYDKIVRLFGDGIIGKGRRIDRRALARIVFSDKRKLRALERVVHPEVIRIIRSRIRQSGSGSTVVIDAPLLVEAKLLALVDRLVVVKCSKKRQIERCVKKFRIKREEALRRIESQMPLSRKLRIADLVIDSNGAKSRTRRLVRKLWEENAWI
jgi:dephospho-CoA kinase